MIKLKVYDKKTDTLKRTVICKDKKEYRNHLCQKVDHTTEYAFGTKLK